MIIRPVTRDDYNQWLPLWDGYNAFYGRSGPTALPQEITQITWTRFFDAYEPMHALVAESEEGKLLGLTHYLFHRSTISTEPSCYLQDLFTNESARGKGIGRALIEGVYERAKSCRMFPRILAHPRDQPHCHGTLQQGRPTHRLRGLPQNALARNC